MVKRKFKAGFFVYNFKINDSAFGAQHHPPAQAMPFFIPEYIIFDDPVPQGKRNLNDKIYTEKDQDGLLILGSYNFISGVELLSF